MISNHGPRTIISVVSVREESLDSLNEAGEARGYLLAEHMWKCPILSLDATEDSDEKKHYKFTGEAENTSLEG